MTKTPADVPAPAKLTTRPIANSHPTEIDPEFVDAPGLQARFGIKRSLAYALLANGSIKGVSLRRNGAQKGKRLFAVASVRAFLKKQMTEAHDSAGSDLPVPPRGA